MQHSAFGFPGTQPLGGPFPLDTQHLPPWQSRPKKLQQSAGEEHEVVIGLQQIPVAVHSWGGSQQSYPTEQATPGPPLQHTLLLLGEQRLLQHSGLVPVAQPLGGALPLVTQHRPPWQSLPKKLQQSAGAEHDVVIGLQQIPVAVHSWGGSQHSNPATQATPGPPLQHTLLLLGEQRLVQHCGLMPPAQAPSGVALPLVTQHRPPWQVLAEEVAAVCRQRA